MTKQEARDTIYNKEVIVERLNKKITDKYKEE